jgi:radical SAM superfamily enzyme YgiQ (UPF0313 family)
MYREKRFRVKSLDQIREDLLRAQIEFPKVGRVFLCDGDALAVPHATLVAVLEAIQRFCPNVIRVATYANAKSVASKTDKELAELHALNLKLFHMGLESGDDETLRRMEKSGDARFHITQAARARAANIKLFVTVLLGLGGRTRSQAHALETARTLTAMNPGNVGALSLMLIPGTPLYADSQSGKFEIPSQREILLELRTMLERTEIRGMFYANHASNYLPIRARLPRDRAEALAQVDAALEGRVALVPEWARGV